MTAPATAAVTTTTTAVPPAGPGTPPIFPFAASNPLEGLAAAVVWLHHSAAAGTPALQWTDAMAADTQRIPGFPHFRSAPWRAIGATQHWLVDDVAWADSYFSLLGPAPPPGTTDWWEAMHTHPDGDTLRLVLLGATGWTAASYATARGLYLLDPRTGLWFLGKEGSRDLFVAHLTQHSGKDRSAWVRSYLARRPVFQAGDDLAAWLRRERNRVVAWGAPDALLPLYLHDDTLPPVGSGGPPSASSASSSASTSASSSASTSASTSAWPVLLPPPTARLVDDDSPAFDTSELAGKLFRHYSDIDRARTRMIWRFTSKPGHEDIAIAADVTYGELQSVIAAHAGSADKSNSRVRTSSFCRNLGALIGAARSGAGDPSVLHIIDRSAYVIGIDVARLPAGVTAHPALGRAINVFETEYILVNTPGAAPVRLRDLATVVYHNPFRSGEGGAQSQVEGLNKQRLEALTRAAQKMAQDAEKAAEEARQQHRPAPVISEDIPDARDMPPEMVAAVVAYARAAEAAVIAHGGTALVDKQGVLTPTTVFPGLVRTTIPRYREAIQAALSARKPS